MMDDEEFEMPEVHEIGDRVNGMVLVCQGDDVPSEFSAWLKPLISRLEKLFALADKHQVYLRDKDSPCIESIMEFCEAVGIEFVSTRWDGLMIRDGVQNARGGSH